MEALRAVDITVGADAGDRAQVDELDLVLGHNDVVGLEVVVDHAARVEVVERGQDLEDVRDRDIDGQQAAVLEVAASTQRGAAHVFHDDEAAGHACVVDEVKNLHNPRVRDVREEFALGAGGVRLVRVLMGLHALQHDDAFRDDVVFRQVNPAHAAVRDDAQDFVLARNHVAGAELRRRGLPVVLGLAQRVVRVRGHDEGQAHHAVRDLALGARGGAPLAEGHECLVAFARCA